MRQLRIMLKLCDLRSALELLKTNFDCTVSFHLKEHFKRAPFLEVDPAKWLSGC